MEHLTGTIQRTDLKTRESGPYAGEDYQGCFLITEETPSRRVWFGNYPEKTHTGVKPGQRVTVCFKAEKEVGGKLDAFLLQVFAILPVYFPAKQVDVESASG